MAKRVAALVLRYPWTAEVVTDARPKISPRPIPACANPRPVKTSEKRPIFRSARKPSTTAATAKLRKNQWAKLRMDRAPRMRLVIASGLIAR